ncbi:MAG: sulfotransferase [Bacteroidetes bacterium]|nr:sulfotransferase [Bacteroidota bacterium]
MKIVATQMIGTQRSGSNLLRLMMSELDNISAPHPPHILERFMPLLPAFGDLTIPKNFYTLVDHVCLLVEYNPVPWKDEKFFLNREEVIGHCKEPSLEEVAKSVYEILAEKEGSSMWMCKSMANIHYVDLLEKRIKPFYIHLYRDGRDVALSFKKAIVGEKHIYSLAKQWQTEQELSLALYNRLGTERVIQVKYENLLANPGFELQKICATLGLLYKEAALDFYKSEESKKTAQSGKMWENVEKPVIKNNFGKFKNELTEEDIRLFEQVAGDTLLKLGYPLCFPEQQERQFSEMEINFFQMENKRMKQDSMMKQKPEDIAKRKRQDDLLKKIKSIIPVEGILG